VSQGGNKYLLNRYSKFMLNINAKIAFTGF